MKGRVNRLGVGGLLGVWLMLIYVYLIDVPPPREAPLKFRSGQAAMNLAERDQTETWEVKPLQARFRDLPATPKHNIFSMAPLPLSPEAHARIVASRNRRKAMMVAAAPPAAPPPSPEAVAQQQDELAAQAARQQEELAAQTLRQQEELRRKQVLEHMGQYRYLGYLDQQGIQKAFLGKGREIYILRQGDLLDGKFLVSAIAAAAVTIRAADSNLETTLKLKKEEPPSGT